MNISSSDLSICLCCWQDDVEAEMRRLKLELKQTMEMYSTACKEALSAKQKVRFSTAAHDFTRKIQSC